MQTTTLCSPRASLLIIDSLKPTWSSLFHKKTVQVDLSQSKKYSHLEHFSFKLWRDLLQWTFNKWADCEKEKKCHQWWWARRSKCPLPSTKDGLYPIHPINEGSHYRQHIDEEQCFPQLPSEIHRPRCSCAILRHNFLIKWKKKWKEFWRENIQQLHFQSKQQNELRQSKTQHSCKKVMDLYMLELEVEV